MKLSDIPAGFWLDSRYNKTVVSWGADGRVHIAHADDYRPYHGLEASPSAVKIAGSEHDNDLLCTICESIVQAWIDG